MDECQPADIPNSDPLLQIEMKPVTVQKKGIKALVSYVLKRGGARLKEWTCVQVGHHKRIREVIEEHQKQGWRLHTYQAQGTPTLVNHYLLFERGSSE